MYQHRIMDLRVGDEISVTVQGIGTFGEGLARHNDQEIFIPKTMAGDIVKIRIIEKKKGRFRAETLEILKQSADRQKPLCSHFEDCGGCDFQHISYDAQVSWKVRMTKHWIRRSPLAPELPKIEFHQIQSPSPYGYRHRARLQIKNHKLHFFRPQSTRLLELHECPIMVDGFFSRLQNQALTLPDQRDWNQSANDHYHLDGHDIHFDADCFTQGNLGANELMWAHIRDAVENLDSKRVALDLFCGIGNFSIPLTDYFESVIGVESSPSAIAWAKKNSDRVDWREGDAKSELNKLVNEKKFFDLVLLDPPRQGAYDEVQILSQFFSPCVIYISCNIETLMRDIIYLTKRAKYKISSWTTVDLFPQTHHIESIVILRL